MSNGHRQWKYCQYLSNGLMDTGSGSIVNTCLMDTGSGSIVNTCHVRADDSVDDKTSSRLTKRLSDEAASFRKMPLRKPVIRVSKKNKSVKLFVLLPSI